MRFGQPACSVGSTITLTDSVAGGAPVALTVSTMV